jgi:hypothetical protein
MCSVACGFGCVMCSLHLSPGPPHQSLPQLPWKSPLSPAASRPGGPGLLVHAPFPTPCPTRAGCRAQGRPAAIRPKPPHQPSLQPPHQPSPLITPPYFSPLSSCAAMTAGQWWRALELPPAPLLPHWHWLKDPSRRWWGRGLGQLLGWDGPGPSLAARALPPSLLMPSSAVRWAWGPAMTALGLRGAAMAGQRHSGGRPIKAPHQPIKAPHRPRAPPQHSSAADLAADDMGEDGPQPPGAHSQAHALASVPRQRGS